MSSLADKRTPAQRLGLDRLVVDPPTLGNTPRLWPRYTGMFERKSFRGYVWDCPHCGNVVPLRTVADTHTGYNQSDELPDPLYAFVICRCETCEKAVFVKYNHVEGRIAEAYPYSNVSPDSFESEIPEKVRDDLANAMRCFYAQSYKGSVAMNRRAFQNIAKDWKIKARDIKDEIAEMLSLGLITRALASAAQEIRQFGAYGAHPQDDELDGVDDRFAIKIIELMRQFTQHLYVMPQITGELAKMRQDAKQKQQSNS